MSKRESFRRVRRLRRKLFNSDPTTNPVPGSEELEDYDAEFEEWMTAAPGAK